MRAKGIAMGMVLSAVLWVVIVRGVVWICHEATDWQRAYVGFGIGGVALLWPVVGGMRRRLRRKARARELLRRAALGVGIERMVRDEWRQIESRR